MDSTLPRRGGNLLKRSRNIQRHYSDQEWFILPYAGHRQIGGNHDIQWIKEGLPGAGNLLLFNNGMSVPRAQRDRDAQSEVVEINPYLGANGVVQKHYVNPPEAGYTFIPETDAAGRHPPVTRLVSNQVVAANRPLEAFVSYHSSGVQRLPNGNNLVSLARPGRLVELTPDDEVVWEYVNPVTANHGIVKSVVTGVHTITGGGWSPYRYAADHPGLAGRDLPPKGLITEFHNQKNPRTGEEQELRPKRNTDAHTSNRVASRRRILCRNRFRRQRDRASRVVWDNALREATFSYCRRVPHIGSVILKSQSLTWRRISLLSSRPS